MYHPLWVTLTLQSLHDANIILPVFLQDTKTIYRFACFYQETFEYHYAPCSGMDLPVDTGAALICKNRIQR